VSLSKLLDSAPARRIGAIVNLRAGAARRDPQLVPKLRALLPSGRVHATRDLDDVDAALASLREQGTQLLVVVGGDGSVAGTLTELLRAWPEAELPWVALACGGTVNTIARSLGARGRPDAWLRRLAAAPRWQAELRPVLRARADAAPPRFGMIAVAGAAARFLERYYAAPRQGSAGAARVIAEVVASGAVGGALARGMFAPFRATIEVDGRRLDAREHTLVAASGVRHIGLGVAPFQHAGRDASRFHFLATSAGALRIAAELPALRLGRALQASCLHHFAAGEVALKSAEPLLWSLDAELFEPASALSVTAGPALHFVSAVG
jgi:diacylglycerol kinase family enzyme